MCVRAVARNKKRCGGYGANTCDLRVGECANRGLCKMICERQKCKKTCVYGIFVVLLQGGKEFLLRAGKDGVGTLITTN